MGPVQLGSVFFYAPGHGIIGLGGGGGNEAPESRIASCISLKGGSILSRWDWPKKLKISDVEYQGDMSKAIFYYTAQGRGDVRQRIKDMASESRMGWAGSLSELGPILRKPTRRRLLSNAFKRSVSIPASALREWSRKPGWRWPGLADSCQWSRAAGV